jgi:hypothetical protein
VWFEQRWKVVKIARVVCGGREDGTPVQFIEGDPSFHVV